MTRTFIWLAGHLQSGALRVDDAHQVFPGLDERFGAFLLEPSGERVDIDASLGKLSKCFSRISVIRKRSRAEFAMRSERVECRLRHGVHRERRREGLDVKDVGRLGVLRSGAGPK